MVHLQKQELKPEEINLNQDLQIKLVAFENNYLLNRP